MDYKKLFKFLFFVFFLVFVFILFRYTALGSYLRPENVRDFINSFGVLAPVVYLVIYSLAPTLMIPGSILSLSGGLAFGGFYGTVYTVIGATIGSSVSYLVARMLGRDFLEGYLKGRLKTFDDKAAEHGFKLILFLRFIPLVPFSALNFGAGLSMIKFKDYLLGTFFGIIPGTFVYVYLGSTLTEIGSVKFFVAVILFALLAIVPILYKKFRGADKDKIA